MSRQLIAVLTKQVHSLEGEVERLKEVCRESNTCNLLVFCSQSDMSVAAVTNTSNEGIEMFSRVSEMFQRNQANLHKRGIGYAVIEDVPINTIHDTPFPTKGGGSVIHG